MLTTIQQQSFNVVFILALLVCVHAWQPAMAQAEMENLEDTPPTTIEFRGTGPEDTKSFTVEDGWKIEWETESPTFRVSAHGSARRPYVGETTKRDEILRWFERLEPIMLANTTQQHGSAIHPFGGTFYLKVVTTGPWKIHLQTFKDTKDYLDVPYTGAP